MLGRLLAVFNTVKHLQLVQVRYQLWYRFKTRFIRLGNYTKYAQHTLHAVPSINYTTLIPAKGRYLGSHSFSFLNLTHHFAENIDWNFSAYGKLWNYNLQYFDFLHDSVINNSEKASLIESFAADLINGIVKPEPYPVSLRVVNWILFYTNTGYRSDLFEKALKLQIDYLQNNLEFHIKANHLLENYVTLVFSAMALQDEDLAKKAWNGLQQQVNEQVLPDGGHYECSPMYHLILTGKLILIAGTVDKAHWYFFDTAFIKNKISDMLGWFNSFSFSDDSWAYFNDATGGIAPLAKDVRSAAAEAGIVANVKELKESGYRKMLNNKYELIIDAGDIIPSYQPGHAHSDMLSFCLQHDNQPIVVDTGISTYQSNAERARERGTSAHNTVTVNAKNQSQIWGGFRVGKRAKMTIHVDSAGFLKASHNGYQEEFGIIHSRTFTAEKNGIDIRDEVIGNKTNLPVTACFHFDWHSRIEINETSATVIVNDTVHLNFTGHLQIMKQTYQQATAFNETRESTCVKVNFDSLLTTTIRFN